METKRCSTCRQMKPLSEFHRDRNRIDGHYPICKECRALAEGWTYRPPVSPGFKLCRRCEEVKPLSEFNRRGASKDGYHYRCKKCVTEARGRVYRIPEQLLEGYKQCSKCKKLLPATHEFFYEHKGCRDNLRPDCKECFINDCAKRQRDNREQVNEKNRHWRKKNIERAREIGRRAAKRRYETHRDELLERAQQWRKNNPDWLKAYDREYTKNNREAVRERQRKYRENNLDKIRIHRRVGKQRRRAQERKLPNTFKSKDWRKALEYWKHRCAICGRFEGTDFTLAPDHWIPVSYKGHDNPGTVPTNILPLCHGINGCNNEKCNRNPVEWLIEKLGEEAAMQKLAEIETYFEYVKIANNKE